MPTAVSDFHKQGENGIPSPHFQNGWRSGTAPSPHSRRRPPSLPETTPPPSSSRLQTIRRSVGSVPPVRNRTRWTVPADPRRRSSVSAPLSDLLSGSPVSPLQAASGFRLPPSSARQIGRAHV